MDFSQFLAQLSDRPCNWSLPTWYPVGWIIWISRSHGERIRDTLWKIKTPEHRENVSRSLCQRPPTWVIHVRLINSIIHNIVLKFFHKSYGNEVPRTQKIYIYMYIGMDIFNLCILIRPKKTFLCYKKSANAYSCWIMFASSLLRVRVSVEDSASAFRRKHWMTH